MNPLVFAATFLGLLKCEIPDSLADSNFGDYIFIVISIIIKEIIFLCSLFIWAPSLLVNTQLPYKFIALLTDHLVVTRHRRPLPSNNIITLHQRKPLITFSFYCMTRWLKPVDVAIDAPLCSLLFAQKPLAELHIQVMKLFIFCRRKALPPFKTKYGSKGRNKIIIRRRRQKKSLRDSWCCVVYKK